MYGEEYQFRDDCRRDNAILASRFISARARRWPAGIYIGLAAARSSLPSEVVMKEEGGRQKERNARKEICRNSL